jgi:hypothetical protein
MKILSGFGTGAAIRYELGDSVVLLRDHHRGDRRIAMAGECGKVVRLVNSDDPRLAMSLFLDIQLDNGGKPIRVVPSEVKPA